MKQTTIKTSSQRAKTFRTKLQHKQPRRSQTLHSKKELLKRKKRKPNRIIQLVIKSLGLTWNKPFYERYDKKRRAPKEELIDFMINHFRFEMALKLTMLKDLGTRPKELLWLTVQGHRPNTGIVSITGAKHTVGRDGKLKPKSMTLLKVYIEKRRLKATVNFSSSQAQNV